MGREGGRERMGREGKAGKEIGGKGGRRKKEKDDLFGQGQKGSRQRLLDFFSWQRLLALTFVSCKDF